MAHRFKVVFEAEPDGSAWNVSIPSVDGCFTYGRSLSEARKNIRECLGLLEEQLGSDAVKIAEKAELEEEIRLPAKVRAAVKRFEQTRAHAEMIARRLERRSARAAQTLTEHLSLRDAGELLGLSQEGVRKVIQKADDSKPPARRVDGPRAHR